MPTASLEPEPVTAKADERPILDALDRLLDEEQARQTKIVGPGGESIPLPESAFRALRDAVRLLARDQTVTIVGRHTELTTQQAADLLNVSRPYLITLLERGELPFSKTGAHRRIRLSDLLAYKARRDADRRRALIELTRLSDELGLYE